MSTLGVAIHCGHRGSPCDRKAGKGLPSVKHWMQVVDVNGTYKFNVYECTCEGARPFAQQLMEMKLMPATHKSPKTAFTFAVLKDFQTFNMCAKVSVWDYWAAIAKKTNGMQPNKVKVRWCEVAAGQIKSGLH